MQEKYHILVPKQSDHSFAKSLAKHAEAEKQKPC